MSGHHRLGGETRGAIPLEAQLPTNAQSAEVGAGQLWRRSPAFEKLGL